MLKPFSDRYEYLYRTKANIRTNLHIVSENPNTLKMQIITDTKDVFIVGVLRNTKKKSVKHIFKVYKFYLYESTYIYDESSF